MRLVAIEHERCSELDKVEYYTVPDSMTDEEVEQAVSDAQDEYLAAFDAQAKASPPPPTLFNDVQRYADDLTVKEIKAILAENQRLRAEHQKLKESVTTSFEAHLKKRGFKSLYESADIKTSASWGHRHGQALHY